MGRTMMKVGPAAAICGALLVACAPTESVRLTPQQQMEFTDEMLRTDPGDVGMIPPASTFGAP